MRPSAALLPAFAAFALSAPATAEGIFASQPVFLSHCSARFALKAERSRDPAAAASLRAAAAAAMTAAQVVPNPERHTAAQLESYAAEMGRFLRQRLAADPSFAAELDRSVAQCEQAMRE